MDLGGAADLRLDRRLVLLRTRGVGRDPDRDTDQATDAEDPGSQAFHHRAEAAEAEAAPADEAANEGESTSEPAEGAPEDAPAEGAEKAQ